MSRRVLLRAGMLVGLLFLLTGLTPQTSTLMSAEPAGGQAAVKKAPAIPSESAGVPTSAAELKILKALAEPTELRFIEEPLQGVINYFSDRHKIEIVLDRRALEDVSIGNDEPITFQISGISLRSALDLVLRDLELTWTIDSEVLLVTTLDVADLRLTTKTYDVGDLVVCQDENGRPWDDYDSLIDTIISSVAPDTWEETTGCLGTIEGCTFASAKVLVIRQTCQVHLEVAQLLETIRVIAKSRTTDGQPPVRKRPPPEPAGMMGGAGGGMGGRMGGMGGGGMFSVGGGLDAESEADLSTGKNAASAEQ